MPRQKNKPPQRTVVDVAIVVALEEEYEVLSKNPFFSPKAWINDDGVGITHFEYVDAASRPRSGIFVRVDGMAEQARDAVHKVHQRFDATYWISAGISAALSKDVHPGDIIASDVVISPLEASKAVPSGAGFDLGIAGGRPTVGSADVKTLAQRWRDDDKAQTTFERNGEARLAQIVENADVESRPTMERALASIRKRGRRRLHFGPIAGGPILSSSQEFKKKLLSANRKLLAYDMETNEVGGALAALNEASRFIAVRAVSDYGDAEKSAFEDVTKGVVRTWALRGLADFLVFALRSGLPAQKKERRPATQLGVPTMPPRMAPANSVHLGARLDPDPRAESWDLRYGSLVGEDASPTSRHPVSNLEAAFASARAGKHVTVVIAGPSGIGKTPLLGLLSARWSGRDPVMVAAGDPAIWHGDPDEPVVIAAENHVADLRIDRGDPALVLVDDVDMDCASTRVLIGELDKAADRATGACVVFAVVSGEPSLDLFPDGVHVHYWLPLRGASARSAAFEDLIASFECLLPILQPTITPAALRKRIADLAPSSIDPQFISILLENWSNARFTNVTTAAQFAGQAAHLLGAAAAGGSLPADFIERCASDAFSRYSGEPTPELPAGQVAKAYRKVRATGDWVQDALVAEYAVRAVRHADEGGMKALTPTERSALSRVYDTRVSSLVKQVVLHSDGGKILAGVEKLLYECDVAITPFLVYILGRIQDPRYRPKAVQLLSELRKAAFEDFAGWRNSSQDARLTALAQRAVYISLAYLGDRPAAESYVALLARDPAESALNRGFHLEYYRDRIVRPKAGLDGYMLSDEAPGPWAHTYQVLSENFRKELSAGHLSPKGIIELGTFCSFVAGRLDRGELADELRAPIKALLERSLDRGKAPSILAAVCNALLHELTQPPRTGAFALFQTVYELKHEERAGWRKRGIASRLGRPTERVASHIYGACLMALWLLPDKPAADFSYSKTQVIKLLMLHDVGEAITGDRTPDEKGENDSAEAQAVARIAGMTMMPALHNLHDLLTDWQDFEDAGSNEAKVARDLDYLEALMQARLYRSFFETSADYQHFIDYHREKIRTPPGRAILDIILRGADLASVSEDAS